MIKSRINRFLFAGIAILLVSCSIENNENSDQAINELKDAMEGMLSPEMKEEVTGTVEIRETFKISKVGTIAGCMVLTGKIFKNSGIRIIREGIVEHSGSLISLKRFKDDVIEVAKGYDCGLQVKDYNDLKVGDNIECFQEIAVKKKL